MVCCPFCIHTSERGVVEHLGKFHKVADPGCHCVICCIQSVAGKVSLRVQHAEIRVETKTKDNVFVHLSVSAMYEVLEDSVAQAYYSLSDPRRQIESFVFNSIRGQIPDYTLDEAFRLRTEIAKALKSDLDEQMKRYGYVIIDALITDFDPDPKVKDAMNQINTNARLRIAAENMSEAKKIETVKAAEAEAESQRLSGQGIAEQRRAVLNGLNQSIGQFRSHIKGTTSSDVMTLLLLNQYFDTLKDIVQKGGSKVVFTPGNETGMVPAIRDGQIQNSHI